MPAERKQIDAIWAASGSLVDLLDANVITSTKEHRSLMRASERQRVSGQQRPGVAGERNGRHRAPSARTMMLSTARTRSSGQTKRRYLP